MPRTEDSDRRALRASRSPRASPQDDSFREWHRRSTGRRAPSAFGPRRRARCERARSRRRNRRCVTRPARARRRGSRRPHGRESHRARAASRSRCRRNRRVDRQRDPQGHRSRGSHRADVRPPSRGAHAPAIGRSRSSRRSIARPTSRTPSADDSPRVRVRARCEKGRSCRRAPCRRGARSTDLRYLSIRRSSSSSSSRSGNGRGVILPRARSARPA